MLRSAIRVARWHELPGKITLFFLFQTECFLSQDMHKNKNIKARSEFWKELNIVICMHA